MRLHRRVQLLVLASSLLEFRVMFTGCHVAAAIYHHRIIIVAIAIYHHHISTTNPSYLYIRFVFEIHLDSDSCFLAGVGFGKKLAGENIFPYSFYRLF